VPLLLGGEQEHAKNLRLKRLSGALYFGHFPLKRFLDEVGRCDLVVTAVTMAMHFAIGQGKKIVLFNNIFNRHEFELYGNGEIADPVFECHFYYTPVCPTACMQSLPVDKAFAACSRLLTLPLKRKKS